MNASRSEYSNAGALVSTDWLAEHLDAPDIHVVDASWYLPAMNRDPVAEYQQAHIPEAVYFDIDEIADTDAPYPHTLPSPEKFSSRVRKLGLGDGNKIVVYDGAGVFSAPRVWWMFRYFGHVDVSVLNGGLPKWLAEGRQTVSEPVSPQDRHFTARMDSTLVRNLQQMRNIAETGRRQILDARASGRFDGTEPEPRQGLKSGHIPGSANLPFINLLDRETMTMRDKDSLRTAFSGAGIDLDKPIITTCGSGVSACVLALGLHLLGHQDVAVYDGSWSEWGAQDDTPIAP